MEKIRVGVADDHQVVLLGAQSALSRCADIDVRFLVDNITDLMSCLLDNPVDVLLCDYEFTSDAHADGVALLRRIQRYSPQTKVLFLSMHTAPHIIVEAMSAGAAGFIGKDKADYADLGQAIRSVNRQAGYLPESLASQLLATIYSGRREAVGLASLSEKEAVVVRMICDGLSITEIATRLKRSPKTISNQKNAAMQKLGVKNDVELVTAVRNYH
ncbi:response regulator transcription factor [Pandoraea sp. SD6-2]|uniref:response regulator transcription factor n=1 Tax=Pandoraea sp. SD6-2 TaxID=1286093 RepID=UPI0003304433|nr:response regulator transcription factor [Pandoraea sp. SD6-2]EON11193.1 LuxR family transcriptional regulator [Pandoraea sp. SD6-2]